MWTKSERKLISRLSTPAKVQDFLETTRYKPVEHPYNTARDVLNKRRCHCFEGAVFAAAVLRQHGYAPTLLDLRALPKKDDDHVLFVYQRNGRYGAVSKSQLWFLGYREPIYRSLRELALSFFDVYYAPESKEKTLLAYSRLVDLKRFDAFEWEFSESAMHKVSSACDNARHYSFVDEEARAVFRRADAR